jgi:hypothetical protein
MFYNYLAPENPMNPFHLNYTYMPIYVYICQS